jgi:hypothetical protein
MPAAPIAPKDGELAGRDAVEHPALALAAACPATHTLLSQCSSALQPALQRVAQT